MREAQEEIGLPAPHVDILGAMPLYTTGTGFAVTPVVAVVRPGFELRIDPFEVAEVFEVPLAFLMNPAHHRRHVVETGGWLIFRMPLRVAMPVRVMKPIIEATDRGWPAIQSATTEPMSASGTLVMMMATKTTER